jgi:hypothetical protein
MTKDSTGYGIQEWRCGWVKGKQVVVWVLGEVFNRQTTKRDFVAFDEGEKRLFTVNRARVKDSVGTASPSGPGSCPEIF